MINGQVQSCQTIFLLGIHICSYRNIISIIWSEFSCTQKAQSRKQNFGHLVKYSKNVSAIFDNNKILLFWLYNTFCMFVLCDRISCSVHLISTYSYLTYSKYSFLCLLTKLLYSSYSVILKGSNKLVLCYTYRGVASLQGHRPGPTNIIAYYLLQ